MQISAIKTSVFRQNDTLQDFIQNSIQSLNEGDIVVVTSKLVALSEGRVGKIEDKEKIILEESIKVIETPWAALTLTDDGWGINAGVDESNAENSLILLPKDSFASAEMLLNNLKKYYSVQRLGVLITDTRSIPLRVGTVGRALGFAGFLPTKSYIGKKDLFGRESRVTISNHADALASAAVLVMGEGNEQTPIAIISHAPVEFTLKSLSEDDQQLAFPPEKDIFSKVYNSIEQKSDDQSK
jgi:coenzyme F420-0:L-glutamate ligase